MPTKHVRNLCMNCKVDMGEDNPRQLCGKWRCTNPPYEESFSRSDIRYYMKLKDNLK